MNIIQQLREQAHLTQQELAERAGTSQPTIAAYEAAHKSPTLTTLKKLARAAGLELGVSFVPPLTREDRRSLAIHRAIARCIAHDEVQTIGRAKAHLKALRAQHPGASALLRLWEVWLRLPTRDLIAAMLDPGMLARDMRQVTPFAGTLTSSERAAALESFRKNEAHEEA